METDRETRGDPVVRQPAQQWRAATLTTREIHFVVVWEGAAWPSCASWGDSSDWTTVPAAVTCPRCLQSLAVRVAARQVGLSTVARLVLHALRSRPRTPETLGLVARIPAAVVDAALVELRRAGRAEEVEPRRWTYH